MRGETDVGDSSLRDTAGCDETTEADGATEDSRSTAPAERERGCGCVATATVNYFKTWHAHRVNEVHKRPCCQAKTQQSAAIKATTAESHTWHTSNQAVGDSGTRHIQTLQGTL